MFIKNKHEKNIDYLCSFESYFLYTVNKYLLTVIFNFKVNLFSILINSTQDVSVIHHCLLVIWFVLNDKVTKYINHD